MKYECVSKRGRTTNQSTKFQNFEATWLTVLTGDFPKPSCRLLKLFNKNLGKFTISGLSKISELRKFQKSSRLRKFLNYLDLENFSITELRKFSLQGKNLENFTTSQYLDNFHDNSQLRKF